MKNNEISRKATHFENEKIPKLIYGILKKKALQLVFA